jgi:hypothetical protein
MTAHLAAPVLRVLREARQQLTGARRLDHRYGTIGALLSAFGIEREQKMKPFAGIGVGAVNSAGWSVTFR